jgi:hypothetical protein
MEMYFSDGWKEVFEYLGMLILFVIPAFGCGCFFLFTLRALIRFLKS